MTPLRQRLIEALQLRGLSERTQELSVRAVRHRAEPAHQSPEPSSEEALRPSCLSLNHVTPAARSASTVALCGSPFVSDHPRKRPWPPLTCLRPPQAHPLPVSLSMDAGHTLRQCVRWPRSHACLRTLDAGGLRLQEGTPIARLSGAGLRRAVAVLACPQPPRPCRASVGRGPGAPPCRTAVSTHRLRGRRDATPGPPPCAPRGALSDFSHTLWARARLPPLRALPP